MGDTFRFQHSEERLETDKIPSGLSRQKKIKRQTKRDLIANICPILAEDNTTYGIGIGNVIISKPNRKGKGVGRVYKNGLEALDDN